ncbi:hypothetical protein XM53_13415 [Roseovarius atlanticus]|uniref:Uncharacterized protein n=1 Tax=Roseovarius atlanticus TaxID=1641875 RepID=A0A0T5NSY6_9RHOB|nr:hypothetical protein [Roseovarius atlanticus]KRS12050.1 hypothetical protein XM53_13415 [Roseovarius atlanticus]
MNTALHQDLVWCLQALSQDAAQQRQLYPDFVHLADELVLDFDQALDVAGRDILDRNPDLAALDALIDSKGGLSDYWSDEALEGSTFWQEIRARARNALTNRDLPVAMPGTPPSGMYYVEGNVGWRDRLAVWFRRKT